MSDHQSFARQPARLRRNDYFNLFDLAYNLTNKSFYAVSRRVKSG